MLQHEVYSIPFRKPLHTAAGSITHRKGFWLRYRTSKSILFAEAAPLPGFSRPDDTLETVTFWLSRHQAMLQEYLQQGEKLHPGVQAGELLDAYRSLSTLLHQAPGDIPASLNYALDVLLLQLWLSGQQQDMKPVSLNALANSRDEVLRSVELGYRTLKVKIAVNEEAELNLLDHIRRQYPRVHLRLDANRGWDPGETEHWLPQFMAFDPEYIEEPTADLSTLQDLTRRYPSQIGADERVRNLDDAIAVLEQQTADVFIIKPMMCMGLADFLSILDVLKSREKKIVVTSALDTGLARRSYALLASLFLDENTSHGLATGSLLKFDAWDDIHLIRNAVYYPETRSIKSIYV